MNFRTQVSRALDEEHRATLELMDRVERALAKPVQAGVAPDVEVGKMASQLARHVQQEIDRHFAFEERLFPRLEESGEGDIGSLLSEEHRTITAVVNQLSPLARDAAAGVLDPVAWSVLRRTVVELIERLRGHIDKETMALLPLLDNLLDDVADDELALRYAES
jgi:hemerythrin-like domain-containing protein